jgi:hypothetical protein
MLVQSVNFMKIHPQIYRHTPGMDIILRSSTKSLQNARQMTKPGLIITTVSNMIFWQSTIAE